MSGGVSLEASELIALEAFTSLIVKPEYSCLIKSVLELLNKTFDPLLSNSTNTFDKVI